MAKRGPKPTVVEVECPNRSCPKHPPNDVANGRYKPRDGSGRQLLCRPCGKRLTKRQEIIFYDLGTPQENVVIALNVLVKGMPLRGIAEVVAAKLDTLCDSLRWASQQRVSLRQVVLR